MTAAATINLDHLALASQYAFDNFVRYYGELGGRLGHGGLDPGFYFSQLLFPAPDGGQLTIELLEPRDPKIDDFLHRFLDRNGPGPHHLTFKVSDVASLLARADAAGYPPVGVDLSNPEWKVGYLHPKQSHGIVVQLAQSESTDETLPDDSGLAPSKQARPAELRRIVHSVADLAAADALFEGLLGGERTGDGRDALGPWSDLRWPGGGILRLVEPEQPAARSWMGGRLGRVHHVLLAVDEPALSEAARPLPDESGAWEVAPEYNLGTRLRLVRR
jgi:methylmalonyl-CoA/ethylmalonyl-CoA epimerase